MILSRVVDKSDFPSTCSRIAAYPEAFQAGALAFKLAARRGIHLRTVEQRLDERLDIKARASNQHRSLVELARAFDPFPGFNRPARRRVSLGGLGDTDAVVSDASAFFARWL